MWGSRGVGEKRETELEKGGVENRFIGSRKFTHSGVKIVRETTNMRKRRHAKMNKVEQQKKGLGKGGKRLSRPVFNSSTRALSVADQMPEARVKTLVHSDSKGDDF